MPRGKPGTAKDGPTPPRKNLHVPHYARLPKPLEDVSKPSEGHLSSPMTTFESVEDAIIVQDAIDTLRSLDLAELYAKKFTKEAIDTIISVMRNQVEGESISPSLRMKAAMALISRGWGNPAIAIRTTTNGMDQDKRKTIEKEIQSAQRAAQILEERAKLGFAIPDEIPVQEVSGDFNYEE